MALVVSSIINGEDFPESKLTSEKAIDFMQNAGNLLVLEGNPCEFENLDYEWVDGSTLKLIGNNISKTVNYKELIPVKINSTIDLGSVSLLPGSIEIMPALQVATFALENDREINETVGYIALDIFGLCIGMTEIKILFKAGNIIRKAIIAADIIGTSSNLAIQLIDEDVIDPVLRNRIQIASTSISLLGVVFSLTDVGKLVDDMSETRLLNKEEFIPENLNKYDEIRKSFTESCLEHSGIQKRFSDEILSLSPDLKIAGNICDFECKLSTFGCFSGETEVLTELGKKEIKTISKDDKVWAYNFTKKIKELKPIVGIKNYLVAAILSIVMSSGDTIWATPSHPFYTTSGYKEASELYAGDTLLNYAGRYESIISKALIDTIIQVYDLTVEDNHNYYVGKDDVLVHNNGECFLRNIGDNYITLASKIDELDEARKSEFLLDFYDAPDDVLRVLDENVGAVKAWETLIDFPVFRKNIDYLAYTDDYLTRTGKTKQQFLYDLGEFEDPKKIFLDELEDTPAAGTYANNPSGVWNENPFIRGNAIEDVANVPGMQTPPTFPKIDYYDAASQTATSVKSTDLLAKSYQDITRLEDLWKSYVDDISGQIFPISQGNLTIGDLSNPVSNRVLHIVTPYVHHCRVSSL